ncbi:uncharacterized protein TRAVEDRAFT_49623 [Trametes versicolor FP-101664 SS1]|uniref:uncharacterized protein n=1 Tax=Trametes versicolor (strain FP-101664) TaxID=717944 RepID=UPI0004621A30|nr:uncharacterized protein TRAVEDRAFT_49623 [Trametes versicolor FP-101664 SS1]EIW56801.1 hypothetical protein TRAVEDRAFT_49623 [Trametes versicolor FP-101664 SS1]
MEIPYLPWRSSWKHSKAIQFLNLIGPAVFTTLRIYVLSGKNRILGGVALVLSMAPFLINASTAYQQPPINLPAPLNCAATNTASRSLIIGGKLQAGSAELPEYLGVIGGSIRSSHDNAEDLQSLEFAPPQEEEHQPELEGEIQEIRRDGGFVA